MRLPEYIDFTSAENAAANISRGLTTRTDSWGNLVSISQRVIAEMFSDFRKDPERFDLIDAYSDPRSPVIAAARILDAASSSKVVDADHRVGLSIFAAAAFAFHGNFPSAHTLVSRLLNADKAISINTLISMACFSPRDANQIRLLINSDREAAAIIELIQAFLATGEGHWHLADTLIRKRLSSVDSNLESVALGFARLALRHVWLLSTHKCLSRSEQIPRKYIDRLIDAGSVTLLPTQFYSICQRNLLDLSGNALVCLPTSTGKTLIGELFLASELMREAGVGVFIVPYIAIGNQVVDSLSRHLPETFRVHSLFGDEYSAAQLSSLEGRDIIVATPERFDSFLRRSQLLRRIRAIVIDEAHMIGDGLRGAKLETLISRIRLQQKRGSAIKMLGLSAVFTKAPRFRNWLDINDSNFVTTSWRPTARRVAIWGNDGNLSWLFTSDDFKSSPAQDFSVLGTKPLRLPYPIFPANSYATREIEKSKTFKNAAYICDALYEEYKAPILCMCSTRSSSRRIALELAARYEPLAVLPTALEDAIFEIETKHPHLRSLEFCLRRKVAYHNASLPSSVRKKIEQAVSEKSLVCVCSTTTLAEGVDLPFRITIVAEWLQWRLDTIDKERPFSALKFRNIAGRCGRAGVYTEGDTIIIDNVLGPERFVGPRNRRASIISMLAPAEDVISSLEEDVLERDAALKAKGLAAAFLAAIPENPLEDNLHHKFAEVTLGRTLAGKTPLLDVLSKIREDLLDQTRGALAVASSPLKLTQLGVAANNSLFSPTTARLFDATLKSLPDGLSLSEVVATLIVKLSSVPEQSNLNWSKRAAGGRSNLLVETTDVLSIIEKWAERTPLIEIFSELPKAKKSKIGERLQDWVSGKKMSEGWSARFDDFSEFVTNVIEEFGSWTLRAARDFAKYPKSNVTYPWDEFSDTYEALIKSRREQV